jgi:hypothetical protein
MSGGGGGGRSPDFDSQLQCERVQFDAELQSVKPGAARSVKRGDELQVLVKGTHGPIVAVNDRGQEVGSIVDHMAEILRCTEAGFSYVAKVLEVDAPMIRVHVEHAKS